MLPPSINTMRLATSPGESHFVGDDEHGHVLLGELLHDFKASPISSGSRAEVGSSKSMTFSFMANAEGNRHLLFLTLNNWPG